MVFRSPLPSPTVPPAPQVFWLLDFPEDCSWSGTGRLAQIQHQLDFPLKLRKYATFLCWTVGLTLHCHLSTVLSLCTRIIFKVPIRNSLVFLTISINIVNTEKKIWRVLSCMYMFSSVLYRFSDLLRGLFYILARSPCWELFDHEADKYVQNSQLYCIYIILQ